MKIDYSVSSMPLLQPAPSTKVQGHAAVLLGEVKFLDIKRRLNQAGISVRLLSNSVLFLSF
jgi:hypothetical protein